MQQQQATRDSAPPAGPAAGNGAMQALLNTRRRRAYAAQKTALAGKLPILGTRDPQATGPRTPTNFHSNFETCLALKDDGICHCDLLDVRSNEGLLTAGRSIFAMGGGPDEVANDLEAFLGPGSVAVIESIEVDQSYRRQRGGSALLLATARALLGTGCSHILLRASGRSDMGSQRDSLQLWFERHGFRRAPDDLAFVAALGERTARDLMFSDDAMFGDLEGVLMACEQACA